MVTFLVDGRHAMYIHDGSLIAKIPSLTVTHPDTNLFITLSAKWFENE